MQWAGPGGGLAGAWRGRGGVVLAPTAPQEPGPVAGPRASYRRQRQSTRKQTIVATQHVSQTEAPNLTESIQLSLQQAVILVNDTRARHAPLDSGTTSRDRPGPARPGAPGDGVHVHPVSTPCRSYLLLIAACLSNKVTSCLGYLKVYPTATNTLKS